MNLSNQFNSIPFKFKRTVCSLGLGSTPDFLIIGAQKAGTTSLFNYINNYAENFISPKKKEIDFFSENYNKGLSWYRAHFPFKKGTNLTGEATPNYLFYHKSAKRVYDFNPDIKLIILLRNPIDRAYSQYNFQRNSNKTQAFNPLSFEEATKEELNLSLNEEFTYNYKYRSYLRRGHYYDQIKDWFELFNKEQFLIIESEDFYRNTEHHLKEVFNFLGLKFRQDVELKLKAQNKTAYTNELNENTREYLKSYFESQNKKLYSLLNRDFDWS